MTLIPSSGKLTVKPIYETSFGGIESDTNRGEVIESGSVKYVKGDKIVFLRYTHEEVKDGEEIIYVLDEKDVIAKDV